MTIQNVAGDVTGGSCGGVVLFPWPDLGLQPHLIHELIDQFMVDPPALIAQFSKYTTVTVPLLPLGENGANHGLQLGVFIRSIQSFLVVEVRGAGKTCSRE